MDPAAGQDQGPERDRGDDDAIRVELCDVGHDDGREAVAGRDGLLEPVDDARHLAHPGQPGEGTGEGEDDHRVAGDVDPGVPGGPRAVPDEPDLVAPPAAEEEEPDQDRRHEAEAVSYTHLEPTRPY